MRLTVIDGLPYADGKRVIFMLNRAMDKELEEGYINLAFTNVKWMVRLETYLEECFYVPPLTTLHEDYREAIDEVTILLTNYKEPDTMVLNKLWVMAETKDTIVFKCDETKIQGMYI